MSSKSTALKITGKKCSLPSFLSLSSDADAQKLDHVMRTTCAYNNRTKKPYITLLIVPTKEDIKYMYDKIVDDASLQGSNYEEVSKITPELFVDMNIDDHPALKSVCTLEEAFKSKDLEALLPGLNKSSGKFKHKINGVDVECMLTGISVFKSQPTKQASTILGGFVACAQESFLSTSKSGGRVMIDSNAAALSENSAPNTTKLSAILSIHNVLHNGGGHNGIVNNSILCYANSVWVRLYSEDKSSGKELFNKAILYRDAHPFVDLVMQFTHLSPLAAVSAKASYADYLEVDEYDVYQKLNALTAEAISKAHEKDVNVKHLQESIPVRAMLRQAWCAKDGNVSELVKELHLAFEEKPSESSFDGLKSALLKMCELDESECKHLYVMGEVNGAEKSSTISAKDVCAFLE